jgi:Fe-S cluster biogenesis protein NfuA
VYTLEETVKALLEGLRPSFQVNGADLRLGELSQDSVRIDIIFGPEACRECILPRESLQPMFARLLEAQLGYSIDVIVQETD